MCPYMPAHFFVRCNAVLACDDCPECIIAEQINTFILLEFKDLRQIRGDILNGVARQAETELPIVRGTM